MKLFLGIHIKQFQISRFHVSFWLSNILILVFYFCLCFFPS